jgi:hypothetical protein
VERAHRFAVVGARGRGDGDAGAHREPVERCLGEQRGRDRVVAQEKAEAFRQHGPVRLYEGELGVGAVEDARDARDRERSNEREVPHDDRR